VLARRIHAPLGGLLLRLVAGDAGRLVDEAAAIFGRDDTMNRCALLDDGVAFEPTPVPRKNSTTSRSRDGTPFSRYSLLPSR
jgi:hypothetical protein